MKPSDSRPLPGKRYKRRQKLLAFGEFVKSAREAKIQSQQKAMEALAEQRLQVSQSWVAQLETGRITDPDPEVLRIIEAAYGIDYDRLVYALVRDKYRLEDQAFATPLSRQRWQTFEPLLRRFDLVGSVPGLEEDQLRAKSDLFAEEILDVEGLARWEMGFPKLKELWIVAPHFQDDKNFNLREAVVHNLSRGVSHFYFMRKSDLEEGGSFWLFLRRLAQDQPAIRNRLAKQMHGVGLEATDLRWMAANLIVANPTDPDTRTGFVGLRHEGLLRYAHRMTGLDLEAAIQGIMPFLAKRVRASS